MHERALMEDVMTKIVTVATAENAKRVTRISVRLGALSHFSPEHFREHFDDASRGTIAAGAEVTATVDTEVTAATARDVVLESVEIEERA
jgi:hydrogenase nickel incorporation protein HypA/HybF